MAALPETYLDKIINPDLARGPLRSAEPHGEFKAYVQVSDPEEIPDYMRHIELESPGLFKVRIPCTKMAMLFEDDNVIRVELLEHISTGFEYISSCRRLA